METTPTPPKPTTFYAVVYPDPVRGDLVYRPSLAATEFAAEAFMSETGRLCQLVRFDGTVTVLREGQGQPVALSELGFETSAVFRQKKGRQGGVKRRAV